MKVVGSMPFFRATRAPSSWRAISASCLIVESMTENADAASISSGKGSPAIANSESTEGDTELPAVVSAILLKSSSLLNFRDNVRLGVWAGGVPTGTSLARSVVANCLDNAAMRLEGDDGRWRSTAVIVR